MAATKRPLDVIEIEAGLRAAKRQDIVGSPRSLSTIRETPQDEYGDAPCPSLAKILGRLRHLYPGVDLKSDQSERADHVRAVLALARKGRQQWADGWRADPTTCYDVADTPFGRRILRGLREWDASGKRAHLPSHEGILAYKLLTADGGHPQSTIAALYGTPFEEWLYPDLPEVYNGSYERQEKRDEATKSLMEDTKNFIERFQGRKKDFVADGTEDILPGLQETLHSVKEGFRDLTKIAGKIRDLEKAFEEEETYDDESSDEEGSNDEEGSSDDDAE